VGAKEAVLRAAPIAASAAKNVASVTFSCEEDSDAQTVLDFTQKNLTIKLDVKEINASGTMADRYAIEGDLDVITMNVNDWIPVSNADWLEASKTADGKLHWKVAKNNPSCEVRSTELMAVCNDSPEDADVMGIVIVNQYPGADIIDFKFKEDGTAFDNSPNNNAFTSYAGDGTKVTYKYIEDYCSWAPSTTYGTENSAVEYKYGFWYTNYSSYKPLMEDGFTMEAIFSPNMAHNETKEAKVFSTTQSGGFAIMLGASGAKTNPCDNVDVTRNGSIEFIMHKNGNWNFLVTNVMVEVGKFYHVIGVYDPAAETIKCYVDGELKFTTTGTGALKWPTGHSNFAVCGNTNGDTKMNGSANVTVPVARVYSDPLSTEEVALLTRLAKAPGFEVVK
ncbi:MAG: LamG-like jellyroll fold domain-containing protein, partial [Candidatus Cryptobacteroides sp.]